MIPGIVAASVLAALAADDGGGPGPDPEPDTPFRYYRFTCLSSVWGSAVGMAEIQLFDAAGAAIAIPAVTCDQGGTTSNLRDGNTSTFWELTSLTFPVVLTMDLGAAVTPKAMRIYPRPTFPTRTPNAFKFEGANDPSGPWTTLIDQSGLAWAAPPQSFGIGAPPSEIKQLRIDVLTQSGSNLGVRLAEIELINDAAANVAGAATKTASPAFSGSNIANAYDGNIATFYRSNTPPPIFVQLDFAAAIKHRKLRLATQENAASAPQDFDVLANMYPVLKARGVTGWTNGVFKEFDLAHS